jgi:hypothetical protein
MGLTKPEKEDRKRPYQKKILGKKPNKYSEEDNTLKS